MDESDDVTVSVVVLPDAEAGVYSSLLVGRAVSALELLDFFAVSHPSPASSVVSLRGGICGGAGGTLAAPTRPDVLS